MDIWNVLLSGGIGALVTTMILIWHHHSSEQVKNRKYVMIAITEWIDSVYVRLQALAAHKEKLIKEQIESMSSEEYKSMNNEMRVLLLSEKIIVEVACVYGDGDMLAKTNLLRNYMTNVARIFWNARIETWDESHNKIMKLFSENIDPLRINIMSDLFNNLGKLTILRKKFMNIKIKKLIAREGLIILSFIGLSLLIILTPDLYIKPKPIDLLAGVTKQEDKSIEKIMNFRKKYPEYNDLNNLTLAEKLANKYPEYVPVYQDIKKINERNKNKTDIFDVSTANPIDSSQSESEIDPRIEKIHVQKEKVKNFGFLLLLFGYPIYLLCRFIFWAVKTLRRKE
ncbi:TPA: hypothetical protein ACXHA5_000646 [Legionella pneumophila]|nr:hypothetical protein [Legionella pneumophila]HAU3859496.1 hypothetical protein [Legionella pneumophila]HCX3297693.1 hypothetical protein [Legionella pneumophila]HDQ4272531.1 hypothetical protein [Legionella pneumophila]HDU8292644.1 hypothetical protein [Legionella pneumophila]